MQDTQAPTPTRTLIISRSNFLDIDKIVSTIVLGKILAQQTNSHVDLFLGDKVPVNSVTSIVAPQNVSFREKLSPDFFTLSINRGNAKIKEVKWEETNEDLKLIIYTEQGQLDASHYSTIPGTPSYDYVYTLGMKSQDEALRALGEYSSLWQSAVTFNLDVRAENQRYAANNFIYADSKSFAECVFKFARERDIEVTNTAATELLSCIYWKTNSLRNKYTTFDTLGTVQQLIQNGGSIAEAVNHIFATLSFVEIRARQEIYKTMKLTNEKIAFAQISPEVARQLTKIYPINPEKNPLFKLKDATTSFVLVPLSESSTLVLCSSRDDKLNIKRLFSNYNYVGDALQAELLFNMNVSDTEKEIKRVLLRVFQPETSQPAPAPVPPSPAPQTPSPAPRPDLQPQSKPANTATQPEPQPAVEPTPAVSQPQHDRISRVEPQTTAIAVHPQPTTQPEPAKPEPAAPSQAQPEVSAESAGTANEWPETETADPLEPAAEDMVMVEVPPPMAELGPEDPLPSAN